VRQEADQRRFIILVQWPAVRVYVLENCASRPFNFDGQELLDLLTILTLFRHGVAVELADHRGVYD
jgi:hypothetical protein